MNFFEHGNILYLCNRRKPCGVNCRGKKDYECRHTSDPAFALHKKSVALARRGNFDRFESFDDGRYFMEREKYEKK